MSKEKLQNTAARLARQPELTDRLRAAYSQYATGALEADIKSTLAGTDVSHSNFIQFIIKAARDDA